MVLFSCSAIAATAVRSDTQGREGGREGGRNKDGFRLGGREGGRGGGREGRTSVGGDDGAISHFGNSSNSSQIVVVGTKAPQLASEVSGNALRGGREGRREGGREE